MFLDVILAAATVDDDSDAMRAINKLKNPTDRDEMTDVFRKTIGYDPTTFFDRREMVKIIEDFENESNYDIESSKEKIVDLAMQIYEENRTNHQKIAIKEAMKRLEIDETIISSFSELLASDDEYDEEEDFDEEDIFDDESDIEEDDEEE